MGEPHLLSLQVKLDGRPVDSETLYTWVGPYVLVVATTLPERGLAFELHSTFVGHQGVPTCARHLILGPVGHTPAVSTREHEHNNLDPSAGARFCIYEHQHTLIETLGALGYTVTFDLPTGVFDELEHAGH
jgi:hypothetical protein